jgi:hypothetical protein
MGPDVPPMRLVSTTAVFFSNPEMSSYSSLSQSSRSFSKPRARE